MIFFVCPVCKVIFYSYQFAREFLLYLQILFSREQTYLYLKFQQEICKDIVFKIKLYICKHSDLRNFLVFRPQILTLVILCIKLCVCLNYYCLDYLNKYMIFVMFFLFVIFQSWIPWCLIPKYIFIDFFSVSLRFCSNLNLIIFQSFSIQTFTYFSKKD